MVVQVLYIGLAAQEPQQLVDDAPQVQLLGGQQRESLLEVEAHLIAEHTHGACTRAVQTLGAVVQHMLQ